MSQLWPFPPVVDARTLSRQVWDAGTARTIPGVGRAVDLICGLLSVMPLDDFRGIDPLPRPRILDKPDLDLPRSTFVRLSAEDWLLHGNTAALVTARDARNAIAALKWYPAHAWGVTQEGVWHLHGREVDPEDVVHVQNGADPINPRRGIGVIERYIRSLDRVALQETAERETLLGGGVPSVAIIAPQSNISQPELDAAGEMWEEKFYGPGRRPGIFPAGTQITPLSWSPNDAQMTAARELSLVDVANAFNLEAYWLGSKGSSHTYRSPGPLFLSLLRTTLEPILAPFEDVWSERLLPLGRRVVADREKILGDDFGTTITTLTKATGRPVMTTNEARSRLRLAAIEGGDEIASPPAPAAPVPEEDPEQNEQEEQA